MPRRQKKAEAREMGGCGGAVATHPLDAPLLRRGKGVAALLVLLTDREDGVCCEINVAAACGRERVRGGRSTSYGFREAGTRLSRVCPRRT